MEQTKTQKQVQLLRTAINALLFQINYPGLTKLLSPPELAMTVAAAARLTTDGVLDLWPSSLGLVNTPTAKCLAAFGEIIATALQQMEQLRTPADVRMQLNRLQHLEDPKDRERQVKDITYTLSQLNHRNSTAQRTLRAAVKKVTATEEPPVHVIKETDEGATTVFHGDYETAVHVLRAVGLFEGYQVYLMMAGGRRIHADELPPAAIVEPPPNPQGLDYTSCRHALDDLYLALRLIADFIPSAHTAAEPFTQLKHSKQDVEHLQRLASNAVAGFMERLQNCRKDGKLTHADLMELLGATPEPPAKEEIDILQLAQVRSVEPAEISSFNFSSNLTYADLGLVERSEPPQLPAKEEIDIPQEMVTLQKRYTNGNGMEGEQTLLVQVGSIEHEETSSFNSFGKARAEVARLMHEELLQRQENKAANLEWSRCYLVRSSGQVHMPFVAGQRALLTSGGRKVINRKPAEPFPPEPATAMTPEKLREKVLANNPLSLFFSRQNMEFAGDEMANYEVIGPVVVRLPLDEFVDAYELRRKKPVKNGLQKSAWFRADNFQLLYGVKPNTEGVYSVDLYYGFKAIPASCVFRDGVWMPADSDEPLGYLNYSGPWFIVAPNGRALGEQYYTPYSYEVITECAAEVDFLIRCGNWTTCPAL